MRLLLVLALLLAACCPARAQTGSAKTPTQLTTEINTLAADNTTNAFTLANLRQITLDLVQSMLNSVQFGATTQTAFPALPANPGGIWATIAGTPHAGNVACLNNVGGSVTLVDCGAPPPVLVTSLPPVQVTAAKTISGPDCGTTQVMSGGAYYTMTVPQAAIMTQGCFVNFYNPDTRAKFVSSPTNEFPAFVVWPSDSASIVALGAGAWATTPLHRNRLLAARTVYVDPAGTNFPVNDCLAPAAQACRTVQGAINMAVNAFDLYGVTVTIQLADGTYAENVTLQPFVRSHIGNMVLNGDTASPAAVTIQPASGAAVSCPSASAMPWTVQNLTLAASSAPNAVASNCSLTLNNVRHAGAATPHLLAADGGYLEVDGADTIVTNPTNYHAQANVNGSILVTGTVTCSGATNWPTAFLAAMFNGVIQYNGATFSGCGSVTGPKVQITTGGQILDSAGDFSTTPGNSVGQISWSPAVKGAPAVGASIGGTTGNTTLPANVTAYQGMSTVASATTYDYLIAPASMRLTNFTYTLVASLAAGQSIVATLMLNNVATAATCTIGTGTNTCSDLVDSVTVAKGQFINIKLVTSATLPATGGSWSAVMY